MSLLFMRLVELKNLLYAHDGLEFYIFLKININVFFGYE